MRSLIDTHSHIYVGRFADDIDAVIERARAEGVEAIVVPATKPSEFGDALALAGRYPEVKVALGIHPHHAHEVTDREIEAIEPLAAGHGAVAIGEIGLDYYYEYAPRERQHEVFRSLLAMAKRMDLPAAIHNRESDDDLLRIVEEEQDGSLRFQLHCFSSDKTVLARALELGAMISFTGNITYSKGALDEVVRMVPDDRIMIETDAPYLTPVPHRGKRNEPAYVSLVAAKVAELRGTTLDVVREMTTVNARRFFRLAAALILLLGIAATGACAQPPKPVHPVDTTAPVPFDRLVGIGGLLASSTYISGATTEASGIGYGVWLTVTPLQPLDIDWLQLDIAYTSVKVIPNSLDEASIKIRNQNGDSLAPIPPNLHRTLDIKVRATANPRKVVTFFGSLGVTHFSNEFGIDQYLIDHGDTTLKDYRESAWGISGSFGISLNLNFPFGTFAPTAEWHVAAISGERPLSHRQQEFFVSQPRIGILFYPNLRKLLH
ncbi:MAG: TatD family hydrolase [Bacteroidetes bacterium]|nr:TatD family hydrolase [Bacteroidota bacterium]